LFQNSGKISVLNLTPVATAGGVPEPVACAPNTQCPRKPSVAP
jgi:hypothetical protein